MNAKTSVLTIAILAIALVGAEEAFAKGTGSHQGTKVLSCNGATDPFAIVSIVPVDEVTNSVSVEIVQKFGNCTFQNENSRSYDIPFMPLKYTVELIDTDFDYVVETHIVTGVLENSFNIEFSDVFEDIPYCVKTTATWMSVFRQQTKTIETESQTCF